MRRGEVWTISAGGVMSKPRPAVIVQSDDIEATDTVIVCPLTTFGDEILPTRSNGLQRPSSPMAHRVAAVKKSRLGEKIGTLSDKDMETVSEQLKRALGL